MLGPESWQIMAELPKIVWHRLRRTSAGAAPSPAVASVAERTKSEHPDANLLTAFLEQSLTKRERALVMSHLAECAECREQISLVLPELEPESPLALRRAQRRPVWRLWQTLRWGALAASLGALAVLVVLHHPALNVLQKASPPGEPASVPAAANSQAENSGGAPGALSTERSVSPPRPSREAEDMQAKEQAILRTSNKYRSAKAKDQPGSSSLAFTHEPGERVAELGAPAPAVSRFRRGVTPESHNSSVVGGPSPIEPSKEGATREPIEKAPGAVTASSSTPELAKAQIRQFGREVAREETATRKKVVAKGESSNLAEMKSRPEVTVPAPSASAHADEFRSVYQSAPATRPTSARPAVVAQWTLSSSGKLERSLDHGRTWTEIQVDRNITFRALAAVGSDVWVGGSKGALYHSTDSGTYWDRVNLLLEGTTVTDDIIRIDFEDSSHGTVTTAAGASCITVDGGRHWTKQVGIR